LLEALARSNQSSAKEVKEMIAWELLRLIGRIAVYAGVVAVLLYVVPRRASRPLAIGLAGFLALSNLGFVVGGIMAIVSPYPGELETEKNQLEFHRGGANGEVRGVVVRNPPPQWSTAPRFAVPLAEVAAGNLLFGALIFVFLQRAGAKEPTTPAAPESANSRGAEPVAPADRPSE
jgi:hypothetical protein